MNIVLENNHYFNENYKTNVYINGVLLANTSYDSNMRMEFSCSNQSIVEIQISNIVFKGRNFFWCFLLYWLLALVNGLSEKHPFGYPCDMVFIFEINNKNVNIKTNPFFSDTPFLSDGVCKVKKNDFCFSKKIKKRWIFGEVIPVYIFDFLFLALFFLVDITSKYIFLKWVFCLIPLVLAVLWTKYVIKVIKKIKEEQVNKLQYSEKNVKIN